MSKSYVISNRTRSEWRTTSVPAAVSPSDLLNWDFCKICLHQARNPCCCPNGDVFCKECILEYIISHKSEANGIGKSKQDEISIKQFMDTQRIAPQPEKKAVERENPEKRVSKPKTQAKDSKCQCPECKIKLKWKKILSISICYEQDRPKCPICSRPIVGKMKAIRLPCTHVICEQCLTGLSDAVNQCPLCHSAFESYILLNRKTIDSLAADGAIHLKKEEIFAPFG